MLQSYKDYSSLMEFAEGQMKLIGDLSKKIVKLEDENKHLTQLLETTTDIVKKPQIIELNSTLLSNEEIISETQLKLLKDTSFQRELTLEECKKVSEYSKILNTVKSKSRTIKGEAKQLSDNELLALFDDAKQTQQ